MLAVNRREAARRLGVSPGAAYRHFEDKDALLNSVARKGFDLLAADFEAAAPFDEEPTNAAQALARFEALGAAYLAFARHHYGLWRLMFGPYGAPGGGEWPVEDRPNTYDWLRKTLAGLQATKVIGPTGPDEEFFAWSVIHGASDLKAAPPTERFAPKEAARRCCRLIVKALA